MTQPTARKFLVIATVPFGSAGLVGIAAALLAFMMFDAPGSEKNPATIVLFCSVLTFPVACALSILLGWILYTRKNFGLACALSSLPALNLFCGIAASIWLEIFNNGSFS